MSKEQENRGSSLKRDDTNPGVSPQSDSVPARPYLLAISGPAVGQMFRLRSELTIGRSETADIVLNEPGISRQHARVSWEEDGSILVCDLNSTNGIEINGVSKARCILEDGDRIQIGDSTILKFSCKGNEAGFDKSMYDAGVRDSVTKLFNRSYFNDRLKSEFNYYSRSEDLLVLGIIGVDGLEEGLKEEVGSAGYEHILVSVARLIGDSLRFEDVFCRFHEHVFALLFEGGNTGEAIGVAQRLLSIVAGYRFRYEGAHVPLTLSIGLATLEHGNFTSERGFVQAACRAMKQAEREGGNRVVCA